MSHQNVVCYEYMKCEIQIRPTHGCQYDERLNTEVVESGSLVQVGFLGELEHLKIQTRLIDEKFPSLMGVCVSRLGFCS